MKTMMMRKKMMMIRTRKSLKIKRKILMLQNKKSENDIII
jgi:hypothetical protein